MNRRPFLLLSFVSALLFSSALVFAKANDNWEFVDQEDGIRTWKLEIPGQDLPGFRGQAHFDASAEKILTALLDRASHTKWMHRCAESSLLKKIDDSQAILYNRTDAPWPIWDRDVIVQSNIKKSADGKQVDVEFANVDSNLRAVPDKVVRMPKLVGFYKLRETAPGKTEVTYQIESDIGGSIPAWLAKRAAKELPYVTLSKLRDRVAGKI
jgi:hypothetical protein